MEKIGNKSAALTFSNVTTLVVTMITSMIIARYRTLEENGTYTQLLLVINTVMPFALLGIPNSITYFLGKASSRRDQEDYLGNYYSLLFLICLTVGIALFLLSSSISNRYNNIEIFKLRYVFLVFPICLQITSTINDVLISVGKVKTLVLYRITYSLVLLLVNILMVIFQWKFETYILIYTIVLVTLSIVVIAIIYFAVGFQRFFFIDKDLIRSILKFSIPMGISTVIGTLTLEFDKLFISMKYSTEVLGMYNYVAKELPIIALTNSVTSVLLPATTKLMSKGNKTEAVDIWKKSTIITFSFTMFFSCGVFVFGSQVISILYSDKYLDGLTIFRIYTFTILLRFTYFGLFFNCTGNARRIMYYSLAGLAMNIVLNYVFFYIFGINGPALATVVSLYVTDYLELRGTAKLLNISFLSIMPWKQFLKIACLNVLLGLVFSSVKKYIPLENLVGDNLEAVFLAMVWGITYLIITKNMLLKAWKGLNRGD